MDRKKFIKNSAMGLAFIPFVKLNAMLNLDVKSEEFFFKDDGIIPNSKYPLLLYKNAFSERGSTGAEWLEKKIQSK